MSHLNMTVGFAIYKPLMLVALIEKMKPEWQAGKLNGIGGKVLAGETPLDCQCREFEEETRRSVDNWTLFCTIYGQQIRGMDVHSTFAVHFFRAFVEHDVLRELKSAEEERIIVDAICNVNATNAIANTPWLLRMALDIRADAAVSFEIHEQYAKCGDCGCTAHPNFTAGSKLKPVYLCENCGQRNAGEFHSKEVSRAIYFQNTERTLGTTV